MKKKEEIRAISEIYRVAVPDRIALDSQIRNEISNVERALNQDLGGEHEYR
jgi:hypothetical protein